MQSVRPIMNSIDSVVTLCQIQIEQLIRRQEKLLEQIEDGQLQMHYLRLLMEHVKKINTLDYNQLDKSFFDYDSEDDM